MSFESLLVEMLGIEKVWKSGWLQNRVHARVQATQKFLVKDVSWEWFF